jgi:hypothetical protein
MPKDGPVSGSGYRFGARAAMNAGLSPAATNPRSLDPQAGQNLDDFSAYYKRAKKVGRPLPVSRGMSAERADTLRKSKEQTPSSVQVLAVLQKSKNFRLELVRDGKDFRFRKFKGIESAIYISLPYGSRDHAMDRYNRNSIFWLERIPIPTEN